MEPLASFTNVNVKVGRLRARDTTPGLPQGEGHSQRDWAGGYSAWNRQRSRLELQRLGLCGLRACEACMAELCGCAGLGNSLSMNPVYVFVANVSGTLADLGGGRGIPASFGQKLVCFWKLRALGWSLFGSSVVLQRSGPATSKSTTGRSSAAVSYAFKHTRCLCSAIWQRLRQ